MLKMYYLHVCALWNTYIIQVNRYVRKDELGYTLNPQKKVKEKTCMHEVELCMKMGSIDNFSEGFETTNI